VSRWVPAVATRSAARADRNSPNIYTVDPAVSYLLTPSLQLDTTVSVGLNRDAPRLVIHSGISQRFQIGPRGDKRCSATWQAQG
jgi:hypothetical protein